MRSMDTRIGIIGTGNIGSSLAALFTGNGFEVTALAENDGFIADGKAKYSAVYDTLGDRGLVSGSQRAACEKLITYTTDYGALADVEIIFECVFEDLELKFGIYRKIEENCANLKALASTTSALSPDDLIKGLEKYKDRLVVAHPFNPPHVVLFVELVKSAVSSDEAVKLVSDVLEASGRKVCVMKKSAPGFIANRLQHALLREAMYMVDEGLIDPRDIDKALMHSFMPRYTSVGLFEHQDSFGLDMVQNVQNYLFPHLCDAKRAPSMTVNSVKNGDLGQKTGKGTYEWDEASINDFRKRASEPYWKYFNWNLPSGS